LRSGGRDCAARFGPKAKVIEIKVVDITAIAARVFFMGKLLAK
jgi:hypothetical protein